MEPKIKALKNISLLEAQNYVPAKENFYKNFICFYTLKSSEDPYYPSEEGWEEITYYTDLLKNLEK